MLTKAKKKQLKIELDRAVRRAYEAEDIYENIFKVLRKHRIID